MRKLFMRICKYSYRLSLIISTRIVFLLSQVRQRWEKQSIWNDNVDLFIAMTYITYNDVVNFVDNGHVHPYCLVIFFHITLLCLERKLSVSKINGKFREIAIICIFSHANLDVPKQKIMITVHFQIMRKLMLYS